MLKFKITCTSTICLLYRVGCICLQRHPTNRNGKPAPHLPPQLEGAGWSRPVLLLEHHWLHPPHLAPRRFQFWWTCKQDSWTNMREWLLQNRIYSQFYNMHNTLWWRKLSWWATHKRTGSWGWDLGLTSTWAAALVSTTVSSLTAGFSSSRPTSIGSSKSTLSNAIASFSKNTWS